MCDGAEYGVSEAGQKISEEETLATLLQNSMKQLSAYNLLVIGLILLAGWLEGKSFERGIGLYEHHVQQQDGDNHVEQITVTNIMTGDGDRINITGSVS